MAQGLRRSTSYHGYHFITTSCYRRQPFFEYVPFRDLFLRELETVRRQYEFVVVGYVIMPEHVHLLIGIPNLAPVPTVMKMLKQRSAHTALMSLRKRGAAVPDQFWQ